MPYKTSKLWLEATAQLLQKIQQGHQQRCSYLSRNPKHPTATCARETFAIDLTMAMAIPLPCCRRHLKN